MLRRIMILNILFFNMFLIGYAYNESNLDNIEYSKYGMTYENEDLGSRLRRLESDYFGMAQSGDIENRIQRIEQMSQNEKLTTTMPFQDTYVPPVKKKTAIRRFFEDNLPVGGYNQGIITGYTPPIINNMGYNRYRNQYYDFLNNPHNNYCPYHNTYHNHQHRRYRQNLNKYLNNRLGYNRYNNHWGYNRPYNYNQAYNRPYSYNPYYRPYHNPGITNVATRSTVHILQD